MSERLKWMKKVGKREKEGREDRCDTYSYRAGAGANFTPAKWSDP